ncbi:polysaccharide biosynthesis protein [Pedobacter frigidisoli]|uniref:Polysaccharide biosynthesis protein n=1 Tax=Pedobacter frigidisoli TaxID=2530455 RepID=A0A4R0NM89_9SPHI|nr:PssD/Cps14F family polysaccharide biosynthesis glycosyltransferase [Pedobacter frigidisoli]TCD01970.1 polysaccharide biosynthesis protein [Pedobacter frigidisoli]
MKKTNKRILFISSAGGHLAEVLEMKELREKYEHLIVTEDVETTRSLGHKYNMKYLKPDMEGRGFSYYINILLNFYLSIPILWKFRPTIIITTGSHTAFPMCVLAYMLRIKVVYILSYARVNSKAKSATFIYPFANLFLVQWESAQRLYNKSIYRGSLF